VKRGELRNVLYLMVLTMVIIGVMPQLGNSTVIPADQASKAASLRARNVAKIKATLERKEVAARLKDYGLTPQEVSSRLDRLSDRQVAEFTAQIDKINAGTDTGTVVLSIFLLIFLILVVLYFTGIIDLKNVKEKFNKPIK